MRDLVPNRHLCGVTQIISLAEDRASLVGLEGWLPAVQRWLNDRLQLWPDLVARVARQRVEDVGVLVGKVLMLVLGPSLTSSSGAVAS